MGNAESSGAQKRLARIPTAQLADIESAFHTLSRNDTSRKSLGLAAFQDALAGSLPPAMSERIFRGIQSETPASRNSPAAPEINREQFALFIIDIHRGTADEKSAITTRMMTSESKEEVMAGEVQQFLEDLIGAVLFVLQRNHMMRGWSLENTGDGECGTRRLAAQLLSQLSPSGGRILTAANRLGSSYTLAAITDWLYKAPMVSVFLRMAVTLGLMGGADLPQDLASLVPRCKTGKAPAFRSLLDFPAIIFLNSHLPSEIQHRWRLLFSTQIHGESFSQMCGHVVEQGPSLLVLRDSEGFIFGGFASQSWEVKPQYKGDSRCFLFSACPQLEVYTYTGYNEHYMYLNHGQQTMPNGLGMGGQHEYFGLWIDSNFGRGHSRAKPRCTTYHSPQLSANQDFTIDAMEVWGLGDLPEHLQTKDKRSVLDADPEVRALLEMTGRTRQSEGLRDKEDDDEL